MESLSRLLNRALLGIIISLPAHAYIPKEHMPLNIPPHKQAMIKMGYHAPYNKQTVGRIVVGKAKIMPNGAIIQLPHGRKFVPSLQQLLFDPNLQENGEMRSAKEIDEFFNYGPAKKTFATREPVELNLQFDPLVGYSDEQIKWINTMFWTTQALDVWTTYKGVKYDCVFEKNPLLRDAPDMFDMVSLKFGVVWAMDTLFEDNTNYRTSWKLATGISTGLVAANSYRIYKSAKRRCDKR